PSFERSQNIPMHPMPPQPISLARDHSTTRTIERVLLEEYAPASVVVNEHGEALFFPVIPGDSLNTRRARRQPSYWTWRAAICGWNFEPRYNTPFRRARKSRGEISPLKLAATISTLI